VNVTMSQKLSLLQSANSVSRVLTADSFAGAGRHDEQGTTFTGFEGLGHAPDGLVLIRALNNLFVDGAVLKRALILTDKSQAI
jgi:hypothetical protein